MSNEQMRAEFERSMNDARFFPAELCFAMTKSPSGRDEYANSHLQSCWVGWQAACKSRSTSGAASGEVVDLCKLPRYKHVSEKMWGPRDDGDYVLFADIEAMFPSNPAFVLQSQRVDEWGAESGWQVYTIQGIEKLKNEPCGYGSNTEYRSVPRAKPAEQSAPPVPRMGGITIEGWIERLPYPLRECMPDEIHEAKDAEIAELRALLATQSASTAPGQTEIPAHTGIDHAKLAEGHAEVLHDLHAAAMREPVGETFGAIMAAIQHLEWLGQQAGGAEAPANAEGGEDGRSE